MSPIRASIRASIQEYKETVLHAITGKTRGRHQVAHVGMNNATNEDINNVENNTLHVMQ